MIGDWTGDEDAVSGLDVCVDRSFRSGTGVVAADHAHPGRGDVDLVTCALRHNLGVAGDDAHPCGIGSGAHTRHDATESRDLQPLFQDERCGQRQRPGSGYRQIVDRAVDGQIADVAARELDGIDHVGVSGHCQTRPAMCRSCRSLDDGIGSEEPGVATLP